MVAILTMGEILVEIMRIKPDVPLYVIDDFRGPFPSGAPAIFIDTVARMGHSAGIIGGVGADDFGRCVLDRLKEDDVDTRMVSVYPDYTTAVAFITYFKDGERKYIFHLDQTAATMKQFQPVSDLPSPQFFHVMGCSLMINAHFREQIFAAIEYFCQKGTKISFDPNIRLELLRGDNLSQIVAPVLERCSILFPGEVELQLISDCKDLHQGVDNLFSRYPLETLVLKRGKRGCQVFDRSGMIADIPAYAVPEVDPTGAGDCFDAGFLCGQLESLSLADSARMAAAAGALSASRFGPMEGQITREKINQFMQV